MLVSSRSARDRAARSVARLVFALGALPALTASATAPAEQVRIGLRGSTGSYSRDDILVSATLPVLIAGGSIGLVSELAPGDRVELTNHEIAIVEILESLPVSRARPPAAPATCHLPAATCHLDGGPKAARLEPALVLATLVRTSTTLVAIQTSDGIVEATPNHPFMRDGLGWTRADSLNPGDRITSLSGEGSSRVLFVKKRSVPLTRVHNLTIERSHAFLVGPVGLLVHNAGASSSGENCPAGLPPVVNDQGGTENCAFCSLAALRGTTVNGILQSDPGIIQNRRGSSVSQIEAMLRRTGLVDDSTTPRRQFEVNKQAQDFMKKAPENTFDVVYWPFPAEAAHSVTAIRRADGTITYIDFQASPPWVSDHLPPTTRKEEIFPVSEDWTKNPTLGAGLDHGRRIPYMTNLRDTPGQPPPDANFVPWYRGGPGGPRRGR